VVIVPGIRPVDPAIVTAEIASELRQGADYVRVTVVLTVHAADVADALTIAWDTFRSAAHDDLPGWEVAAAAAELQPEAPLA
jgi:spore coat polysaccharide biosynthesis protein SpsF (cytidylyltransferase family)